MKTAHDDGHADAYRLSREAACDVRTAKKFLREGIARIKGYALRDRLTRAAWKLGITLPLGSARREKGRAA